MAIKLGLPLDGLAVKISIGKFDGFGVRLTFGIVLGLALTFKQFIVVLIYFRFLESFYQIRLCL